MSCDPNTLAASAACFDGVPEKMKLAILAYELCVLASSGGSTSPQNANLINAGPASGGAATPTFRTLVNADFPTTLTPQFARLGLSVAADAAVPLNCLAPNLGVGVASLVARFNATTSDPQIVIGSEVSNSGAYIGYSRSSNFMVLGVTGHSGATLDSGGNLSIDGSFSIMGNTGISGTISPVNSITVLGGIVTAAS